VFRVLKPGGVARFVTPDLDRIARMIACPQAAEHRYLELFNQYARAYGVIPHAGEASFVDCVNIAFRNYGHQYLYTKPALKDLLQGVGFDQILESPASEPSAAVFRGAQGHDLAIGAEMNNLEAFAFEAVK
jgi:hypothetical protein